MENKNPPQEKITPEFKALGHSISGIYLAYLSFIYIGIMFAFILLLIPLTSLFPNLKEQAWLGMVPTILILLMLIFHEMFCFYSVHFYSDKIILKWLGIPLETIPLSEFKLLCAVGNDREDVLCISRYSLEEIASMNEQKLLRSSFTKDEVPFRKRKANWKASFAKEYLLRSRRNPFGIFRKKSFVMFDMRPSLQYALRKMLPQIPYKNLTDVHTLHISRFSEIPKNEVVRFGSQMYNHYFYMKRDGIHIETAKKDISFIPAEQIKTAVRVDFFMGYSKYYPHHFPLLFITTMSAKELADLPFAKLRMNKADDPTLLIMNAAHYLAFRWSPKKKDFCVIPLTKQNLDTLRAICPNAQILENASDWIFDS